MVRMCGKLKVELPLPSVQFNFNSCWIDHVYKRAVDTFRKHSYPGIGLIYVCLSLFHFNFVDMVCFKLQYLCYFSSLQVHEGGRKHSGCSYLATVGIHHFCSYYLSAAVKIKDITCHEVYI